MFDWNQIESALRWIGAPLAQIGLEIRAVVSVFPGNAREHRSVVACGLPFVILLFIGEDSIPGWINEDWGQQDN